MLVCHVILQDHVKEVWSNIVGGIPHNKSPACQDF